MVTKNNKEYAEAVPQSLNTDFGKQSKQILSNFQYPQQQRGKSKEIDLNDISDDFYLELNPVGFGSIKLKFTAHCEYYEKLNLYEIHLKYQGDGTLRNASAILEDSDHNESVFSEQPAHKENLCNAITLDRGVRKKFTDKNKFELPYIGTNSQPVIDYSQMHEKLIEEIKIGG